MELCCATSDILVGNKAWRGVPTDQRSLEELLPVPGWPMDETMPSTVLSNDTDPTKLGIGNRPNVAADSYAHTRTCTLTLAPRTGRTGGRHLGCLQLLYCQLECLDLLLLLSESS